VFSAKSDIPIAAEGAAGLFSGWHTSSGDVVTSTGVQAANTDYTAILEGIIAPSVNGTVQLIFGSEKASSLVTLRPGCIINIEPYGIN
jgi:hypothetical protein